MLLSLTHAAYPGDVRSQEKVKYDPWLADDLDQEAGGDTYSFISKYLLSSHYVPNTIPDA